MAFRAIVDSVSKICDQVTQSYENQRFSASVTRTFTLHSSEAEMTIRSAFLLFSFILGANIADLLRTDATKKERVVCFLKVCSPLGLMMIGMYSELNPLNIYVKDTNFILLASVTGLISMVTFAALGVHEQRIAQLEKMKRQ